MTNYTKLLNGLDDLEMYQIKENLDPYIKLLIMVKKVLLMPCMSWLRLSLLIRDSEQLMPALR